jgi:hypothetical protein
LILVFYYLNLDLTTSLAQALRPGGLLFQANRNTRFLQIRPSFPQDYLLEPGELGRHVTRVGLRILQYTDGTGDEPHNTQLIARRPS